MNPDSNNVPKPTINIQRLEEIGYSLLVALGEDPAREGLRDTPARFARAWSEFIDYDPGNFDTTFEAEQVDQMVVITGINVWSMCEHHLMPFHCSVAIGYIAADKVLGFSKFARVAQMCAHRLQLQERLALQIAEEIQRLTQAEDVGVVIQGRHLCAAMRGAMQDEMVMHSSDLRGRFRSDGVMRSEFMQLINQRGA